MNILRERRAKLGLTQPQMSAALKTVDARLDIGMVSRMERGVCLPTPPVMEKLEDVLQSSRFELYDFKDIDLVDLSGMEPVSTNIPQDKPKRKETRFRKCYRVPHEFMDSLPEDILSVCGFASWNDWHATCLRRLQGEYGARKKAMNTKEKRA